jgi:hypothetical protein
MLVRVPMPVTGILAAPKCPLALAAFVIASHNDNDGSVALPSGRNHKSQNSTCERTFRDIQHGILLSIAKCLSLRFLGIPTSQSLL